MQSTYIYTYLIHACTCQYVHDWPKTPVQTGSYFCMYCMFLQVYTCLYIYIRAITCKNMTPFEQGVSSPSTYQEEKRQKIQSRHICMCFDGSCCSFQRLLVCCTQRHYIHVRTSTYYYACLCTYMDYILVQTYTNICTYTFAYVSLRQYMNVAGLRSYTCQYVLICKYVGLHTPMTYNVLHAYTYLFGSFFICTYNIRIPLPIYIHIPIQVYTCYMYIRYIIRTSTKYYEPQKSYKNTHKNMQTCKYVQ